MGRPKKEKSRVYHFRMPVSIGDPYMKMSMELTGSSCHPVMTFCKGFVTNEEMTVIGNQPLHLHFDRIVQRPRRYGKALGDRDMNVITRGSILECANNCVDPPFVEVFHVVRGRVFDVKTIIHLCEECFVKLKKEVNFVYPEYSSRKLESIIL